MSLAQQPFSTPVQPIAGFSPDQLAAFQQTRNQQGFAQPFINAGAGYLAQGAAPNSAAQVANYYNPFAQNVFANMAETFGQQNRDFTGALTKQAGGVGADRIAVAQAELARQQGLAAGQTAAGLYQPALAAAQAESQRQQAAGYGLGMLGPAAQNAQLQGTQALLGTGGQQQTLSQAQMNALYQNQLAGIAWPYQNTQFLSGVTSQLAPSQGGTTTMQVPGPSLASQIIGGGTALMGLGGGMKGGKGGGYGANPIQASYGGGSFSPMPFGWSSGGKVSPFSMYEGFDAGGTAAPELFGGTDELGVKPIHDASPMHYPQPPRLPAGTQTTGSDIGKVASTAMNIAGMFMADGGSTGDDTPDISQRPVFKYFPDTSISASTQDPSAMFDPNDPVWAGTGRQQNLPAEAQPAMDTGTTPYQTSPQAMSSNLPYPMPQDNAGTRFGRSPWMALTAAGLGMMAGRSPYAGVNIGTGGLQGIQALEAQRAAEEKEQGININAQRLMQNAQLLSRKSFIGFDPSTGRPLQILPSGDIVTAQVPGGGPGGTSGVIAGLTPAALDAAAERYIKTGTLPPASRGAQGNIMRTAVQNRAAELYQQRGGDIADLPKNWQQFRGEQVAIQRFMSGPQGNTARSLNVVSDHLNTVEGLIDALNNKNFPAFNALAQTWAQQTGSPAPTNFDSARLIVGAEIIKALGVAGAGTAEERQEAANIWNRARSPDQLREASGVIKKLLAGQLRGLRQQFVASTGLGEDKFNSMLLPNTLRTIEGISGGAVPTQGGPTGGALRPMSPDIAAQARAKMNEPGISREDVINHLRQKGIDPSGL